MREQYDTTGLHVVELEAADPGQSRRRVLGRSLKQMLVAPESDEQDALAVARLAREEKSEAADRRWWRAHSAELAYALGNPTSTTSHKHRAEKRGLAAELVILAEVAERDRWKCGICGKRVVKTAKGRRSASLDHIVPISKGGGNLYSNTQLSHLECNWAKKDRDRMASQMRLF